MDSGAESIAAQDSGYFIRYCDGWGDSFNSQTLDALTVSDVNRVLASERNPASGSIGGLVQGFSW